MLKDWRIILAILSNLSLIIPFTGMASFLVLIVKGMGCPDPLANLMSVPSITIATVIVVLVL